MGTEAEECHDDTVCQKNKGPPVLNDEDDDDDDLNKGDEQLSLSSEISMPIFCIDHLRPLATPTQLRRSSDVIMGLQVSGSAMAALPFDNLDQDDPLFLDPEYTQPTEAAEDVSPTAADSKTGQDDESAESKPEDETSDGIDEKTTSLEEEDEEEEEEKTKENGVKSVRRDAKDTTGIVVRDADSENDMERPKELLEKTSRNLEKIMMPVEKESNVVEAEKSTTATHAETETAREKVMMSPRQEEASDETVMKATTNVETGAAELLMPRCDRNNQSVVQTETEQPSDASLHHLESKNTNDIQIPETTNTVETAESKEINNLQSRKGIQSPIEDDTRESVPKSNNPILAAEGPRIPTTTATTTIAGSKTATQGENDTDAVVEDESMDDSRLVEEVDRNLTRTSPMEEDTDLPVPPPPPKDSVSTQITVDASVLRFEDQLELRDSLSATPPSHSMERSDDEESVDDDWVEVQQLEREVMAQLDDEITVAEGAQLMRQLDDDITRLEEKEFMKRLDEEISRAEENERIKALNRPERILEVSYGESFDNVKRIRLDPPHASKECIISEVQVATLFTKLVPRRCNGRKFMDHIDMADLTGHHPLLRHCFAKLEPVRDDPNSWNLTLCGIISKNICTELMEDWLKKMCFRFNMSILIRYGIDIQVEIDATKRSGYKVLQFYDRIMLIPVDNETCLIEELKEPLSHGGLLISLVDGEPCNSVQQFNRHKALCQSQGRMMNISGKRPNPDIQDYRDDDESGYLEEPDRSDSPVPSGLANDQEGADCMNWDELTVCDSLHGQGLKDLDDSNKHGSRLETATAIRKDVWDGLSHPLNKRQCDSQGKVAFNGYRHFETKFKPLAAIEYKDAGIYVCLTISSMWNQHKRRFGTKCDGKCACAFATDFLTHHVVGDRIKRLPNWRNPLGLKAGQYPVGFVNSFCPKFEELLRKERPGESPADILNRLYDMWKKHESTRIFGMECSENCDCITGWESVFNKGLRADEIVWLETTEPTEPVKKKLKTSRSNAGGSSDMGSNVDSARADVVGVSKRSRADERKSMAKGDGNENRKEYVCSFTTSEPMGFYFANEIESDGKSQCKVKSVCPKTAKARDDRIQVGTTVVAVETKNKRFPIDGWKILKDKYMQSKAVGKSLDVVFINRQSPDEEASEKRQYSLLWKHDKWNGGALGKGDGWAGGAQPFSRGGPQISHKRNHHSVRTGDGESKAASGVNDAKNALQPKTSLVKRNMMRELIKTKPKSIMVQRTDSGDRSKTRKRVKFSGKDEERQYTNDFAVVDFLVPCDGRQPKPVDRIRDAFESGTFLDALQLLESGLADKLSEDDLKTLRESIRYNKAPDHRSQDIVRDIAMKDKILKIFMKACRTARHVKALKDWIDLNVHIETFEYTFSPQERQASNGDGLVIERKLIHHGGKAVAPLSSTRVDEISSRKPIVVRQNTMLDRRRVFAIELKRSEMGETLGCVDILLQDIVGDNSIRNGKPLTRQYNLTCLSSALSASKVTLRFERFNDVDSSRKRERKEWCMTLARILDWIRQFNQDMTEKEKAQCTFSVEVPVLGTTLLHSAVMLAEEPLVEKLLDKGAKVSPAVRKLAEVDRGDGYQRRGIAILLKQRVPESAATGHRGVATTFSNGQSGGDDRAEATKAIELGGSIPTLRDDWLFRLEKSRGIKKRCYHFDGGHCRFGRTCYYGHVHDEKTRPPSIPIPHRCDDHEVNVEYRKDQFGKYWYTTGFIDGNEFFYPSSGDGVKCVKTGIWWYRTENSARQALRAVLSGRPLTVL